jgi:hypothetical protein
MPMYRIAMTAATVLSLNLAACTSPSPAPEREVAASRKVLDTSGYLYDPTDRSCDGFPRLQVETMPGT